MANAHQPLGKHMQQKSADELLGCQSHLALLAAMSEIFPAKSDLPIFHAEESMVGDGHPMRVACQIVQDMFRPAEGFLG